MSDNTNINIDIEILIGTRASTRIGSERGNDLWRAIKSSGTIHAAIGPDVYGCRCCWDCDILFYSRLLVSIYILYLFILCISL